MTPARWQQIDQLLAAALEAPEAERAALLAQSCAGDNELRQEVLALLAGSEQAEDFFDAPPLAEMAEVFGRAEPALAPGQQIGSYRILRELGRGGMGLVFLAERANEPIGQPVALKLLWPGVNDAEIVRRFRRERKILANLHHPNIAQFFDSGTTADGRPYIVMEFVAGAPLTDYCCARQLAIAARLRLFQQVCAAVQYAHQNLIIHRDLKPSNILVSEAGAAKLLDFGIARVLDPARHGVTALPTTHALLLTPEYASPEQMRGAAVTTASDVYSLGVLLYELLTGRGPYALEGLSVPEIAQVICESEPERPSAALSHAWRKQQRRAAQTRATTRLGVATRLLAAATRLADKGLARATKAGRQAAVGQAEPTDKAGAGLDLAKARRQLQGDLDNIVMMALRKEPQRRYASVEQLSEDLRRHLDGLPVLARPNTLVYRAGKFIRRNKAGVTLAALVLLTLLGGIVTTLQQARLAQTQARANLRLAYAAEMHLGAQHWELANIAGLSQVLNNHLPQPGEADLRGFEWYYLWRLLNRNGEQLNLPHRAEVWAVAYSPDGKTIATGHSEDDSAVKLWDAATGSLLKTFKGGQELPWSVVFSPDGKKLAGAFQDGVARLWDVASGQELLVFKSHQGRATAVAFAPDGQTLATGSDDETVKLWDAATGRERFTIQTKSGWIKALAFAPDGKLLATGGIGSRSLAPNEPKIRLWDAANGQAVSAFEPGGAWALAFSPDGTKLAAGSGNLVKMWDVKERRERAVFKGHNSRIRSVAFAPNGKYVASASDDRTARLWDSETGREFATLKGHRAEVWSVAFSPDSRKLVTGAADFTAKTWDVATAIELTEITTRGGIFNRAAFAPDGNRLATVEEHAVALRDEQTGQILALCQGHTAGIQALAFAPDGDSLATASSDRTARLWDTYSGKELATFSGHAQTVYAVALSPDGRKLVTGAQDQTAKVWDIASRRELLTLKGHAHAIVNAVAFTTDGSRIVTGSYDRTAKLWDATTGKELATFAGQIKPILCLALSPDGKTLAAGSADSTVKLWELATGRAIRTLTGSAGHVRSIAFSPDGSRLATGSGDGLVRLWDQATGQELIALKGHADQLNSVSFAGDGLTLASGSAFGTVRLWRAAARQR